MIHYTSRNLIEDGPGSAVNYFYLGNRFVSFNYI